MLKISIITVSYNSVETIEDTIKSVISQSYNNIEYIIIDGGSTDGTIKIIENYISSINYFISEKDKGIYDAMNKGISIATGDVIGFLNSDDIYFRTTIINEIMYEFTNNTSTSILYGNLYYVNRSNTNKIIRTWKSMAYFNNFFEFGNVPPHPTLFVRNFIYQNIGLFNLNYKYASDYDFMIRLFKKNIYTSKYINKYIVKMRIGGLTSKNSLNRIKQNLEIYQIWNNNGYKMPLYFFICKVFKKIFQYF